MTTLQQHMASGDQFVAELPTYEGGLGPQYQAVIESSFCAKGAQSSDWAGIGFVITCKT
jgi:hypothetical protein